ncbi:MAG: hypothetical protein GF409_02335 [Candidatus Omnitrophica bacterium]|nr:hypothetical protein [Candidatus Omnitrophota bacterium]
MTLTEALISGLVQGLTEFLPISSSGHLVLVHRLFGFSEPSMFFDICLHAATLLAVVIYFAGDILQLARQRRWEYLFYVLAATVPAVITALFFEERISEFFVSPAKVAVMLVATGIVLLLGQFFLWKNDGAGRKAGLFNTFAVGVAQAIALLPGISRSGVTISAGLAGGMKTEEAFRFSFLLSIPVIIGATLYKGLTVDLRGALAGNVPEYIAGMAAAFLAGFFSLHLLRKVIKGKKLFLFAAYCLLLGMTGIFFWK